MYAYNLQHLLKTVMNLHIDLRKPMTRTSVLALCRIAELLKAIEHTFHRRSMLVAESVNHIIQHLSFIALSTVQTAKVLYTVHLTIRHRLFWLSINSEANCSRSQIQREEVGRSLRPLHGGELLARPRDQRTAAHHSTGVSRGHAAGRSNAAHTLPQPNTRVSTESIQR